MSIPGLSPDAEYLIRKYAFHGFIYASILIPPVYASTVFIKNGRGAMTATKFLRMAWMGPLATSATLAGLGYLRFGSMDSQKLKMRRIQDMYNTNRVRLEDHAIIGGVLCGVLVPALLWRRTRTYHLILGGGSIGAGAGAFAHYIKLASGYQLDQPQLPTIAVENKEDATPK